MYKKLICLISFVFMLSLAGNASADLVAHWKLDEGSGNTVYDSSTSGNDGTFEGDPQWVAGHYGGALEFDGPDDNIDCGNDDSLNITDEITLSAWINMAQRPAVDDWYTIPWKENAYSMYLYGADTTLTTLAADFWLDTGRADIWNGPDIDIPPNDWTHIAVTFNGTDFEFYVNGEHDYTQNEPGTIEISAINLLFTERGSSFEALIDDVRVYNRALVEVEILAAMEGDVGYPYALAPSPKDGALHEDTWVTLGWSPGAFALSHDVYLGDNFDDVSEATRDSDVYRGNQITTFYVAGFPGFSYPDGLVPGTTYYWRIDEVNDTDPHSPWKGDVWSFMIPPKTAYNPDPTDGAEFVDPNGPTLSWTAGFGAKLHTVYFGDSYDAVNDATGGAPMGLAVYNPGILEKEKVYYWRIDEFDAVETHKGDIWSFTTPGAVGNPQPAYDATDVGMNAIMSWTPADSAASHELYIGTDKEAVRTAGAGSPEYKGSMVLGAENFDPGLLDADTTYYWRVDEVDGQGNTAKGPLWIFTTGAFLLVDDFEGYTDDDAAGEAIWQTWIDGFGVADNGAQVGNLLPPYAEQTIVHGGAQSMPLFYTNEGGVTNSEASLALTTLRDWTAAGVGELSLWFRGGSDNSAEPLYVAISNSTGSPAVMAYDDPSAATIQSWTQWRILLQAFADQGINLGDVDKIAIGLGSQSGMASAGGSGTMFIDDIRLYRQ